MLSDDFEDKLRAIFDDPEARSELTQACMALTEILDRAALQWAPVMLRSDDLAHAMNVFGMTHKTLTWFTSALEDYEKSGQRRLDAWANLRVFLVMYALFDCDRREVTGEPAMFGITADDHDLVWGLPFEAIRRRTADLPREASTVATGAMDQTREKQPAEEATAPGGSSP